MHTKPPSPIKPYENFGYNLGVLKVSIRHIVKQLLLIVFSWVGSCTSWTIVSFRFRPVDGYFIHQCTSNFATCFASQDLLHSLLDACVWSPINEAQHDCDKQQAFLDFKKPGTGHQV